MSNGFPGPFDDANWPPKTTEIKTLGASSWASICGQGYHSRIKLFEYKTGLLPWPPSNEFMDRGIKLEPQAVAAAEIGYASMFRHTGKKQRLAIKLIEGINCTCKPDGIGLSDWTLGLEIKVPIKTAEVVPVNHQCQMAAQMLVCDFTEVIYGSWQPGQGNARLWRCFLSPDLQQFMVDRLKEWSAFVDFPTGDYKKTLSWRPRKPEVPPMVTERIL